ncbi:hypothetical protein GLOIN_2v1709121 [Rhizophagus clarus]|uniref:SAM domain-containing protein n=1 Tax=Rhizophagus clarus TaxID=94130 RepID=A0A8H3L5D0_9GLOM|nr:hypothetical protein GLOIN_2v1709121 [Rhizophagus clarus]
MGGKYTLASTSISVTATGNETVSLEIKKYKTAKLIDFLSKEGDLELEEEDLEIIRKQRVNGHNFFDLTQEELERHGMKLGLAKRLVKFAKECKDKKLRSFSSYKIKKDLKEVLAKHGIEDGQITDIPQFTLSFFTFVNLLPHITNIYYYNKGPHNIDDKDEALLHCLKDIRFRLSNMGTVVESNEAIRCEYILTILHAMLVSILSKRPLEKKSP